MRLRVHMFRSPFYNNVAILDRENRARFANFPSVAGKVPPPPILVSRLSSAIEAKINWPSDAPSICSEQMCLRQIKGKRYRLSDTDLPLAIQENCCRLTIRRVGVNYRRAAEMLYELD